MQEAIDPIILAAGIAARETLGATADVFVTTLASSAKRQILHSTKESSGIDAKDRSISKLQRCNRYRLAGVKLGW